MAGLPVDPRWARAFEDETAFRSALASVSLSHPADCDCEVCKAADGDEDAFLRLYSQSKDKRRG